MDLPGFLLSVYRSLGFQYPKFYKMDNLSKLGWLAAEVLLGGGLPLAKYRPEEIGIVLANSSASLDTDIKYYETAKSIASPALFVYTLPNIMIGEICIKNNIKGENAFFVFDHFDVNFIKGYVSQLLEFEMLKICMCGWIELMDENYKAVLFLVEKKSELPALSPVIESDNETVEMQQRIFFSEENIKKIYQSDHG